MTITIDFPPDIEMGLLAQAKLDGLAVSEYVEKLVREHMAGKTSEAISSFPAYDLPRQEWMREFRAWSQSPAHANLPVLSDEAMSREAIYEDRGL